MNVNTPLSPTAIVSYAHSDPQWDTEQKKERSQHVLRFVHAMRQYGIDADVDIFHQNEDWTRWGPERVLSRDFVLIVVSQAWKAAWLGTGDLHLNKGLRAEANAVRSIEAEGGGTLQSRCRLVFLPGSEDADIPGGLHGIARYYLKAYDQSDLEELLRDLTGQPKYLKPPVGVVPVLPPAMTADAPEAQGDDRTSSSDIGPVPIPTQRQSDALPARVEGAAAFEHMRQSGTIAPHVTGERRARIIQLLEQLAALPEPEPWDGPHLPWFRVRNKIESQSYLEIQSANELSALADPEAWTTVRFVWSTSPDSYTDCDVEITEPELAAGVCTVGHGFPGAWGTYYRIDDEIGYVMNATDPLPTFLHENHEAQIKQWRTAISDLSQEVSAAGQSYDAVKQLRDSKIADTPGAVMGPAILTNTEKTPRGFDVVGRAVYLTPR